MATKLQRKRKSGNNPYKFDFTSIPDIGTEIDYYHGKLKLIDVRDYVRVDGTKSNLLVWRRSDGVVGVSGMRSHSLTYPDWAAEYA